MAPKKNATKPTTPPDGEKEPEQESAPVQVTVQVVKQPLNEEGTTYFQGDTFETTPERAEALGKLVTTEIKKD